MDDNLNRWLHFVDKKLPREATGFLKLGLYSELRRNYAGVDKETTPSKLYHLLLEHHEQQSESEVLKLFIYVLRGLGRSLQGNSVIERGFSDHKLKDPGKLNIETEASTEFRFFQCLLQILTKVRKDRKLSKIVMTELSEILETDASHLKNLPALFIALYQGGFIAAGNTDHLQKVLENCKNQPKVNKRIVYQCLEILNRYHNSDSPTRPLTPSGNTSDPSSAMDSDPDSKQHQPANGNGEKERLLDRPRSAGKTYRCLFCSIKLRCISKDDFHLTCACCCRCVCCGLGLFFLLLMIGMICGNVFGLGDAFGCHETTQYPDILSNSTIKGGEFSSCLSGVTVAFREYLHYTSISAYKVSCRDLISYNEPIQWKDTIDDLENEPLSIFDCSMNPCYFANGFNAQMSVSVDTPGGARISVCWFTNESDYIHFLGISKNIPSEDNKGRGCIKVLEFTQNVTNLNNTVQIRNPTPSYYYMGIRVEKEVTSLRYNFTTERSFYNRSDFKKAPDCVISSTDPVCDIEQLPGKACVMLYADPELNANASSYYQIALHGQKKGDGQKNAFIALWVLIGVLIFLVFTLIFSAFVCHPGVNSSVI